MSSKNAGILFKVFEASGGYIRRSGSRFLEVQRCNNEIVIAYRVGKDVCFTNEALVGSEYYIN